MSSELNGVEKSMNYYLTKRKKGKRKIWYAFFTDPNNSQKSLLSTSVELLRRKLGINTKTALTREKEAYVIVERAIAEGLIRLDREKVLFREYVEEFWDFDKSSYILRRNQKKPNSIGRDYAHSMLSYFKNHAAPNLPIKLEVSQVTALYIEGVVDALFDKGELSNATIQKVVQSMSVPLKDATRKKLIAHNPMDGVDPISSSYKQRGIYTVEEINEILSYLYKRGTEGVNEPRKVRAPGKTTVEKPRLIKTDLKPFLAVALSAFTGMRSGEVRALCSDQVRLVTESSGIIAIDRAVNDYSGEKLTKGKRTRQVPIPRSLGEALQDMANQNPHEGSLKVFWSDKSRTNPISASYLINHFYKALKAIGITDELRLERNVDFHSLRHTFNSTMRGRVTDKSLRAVVGHETEAMSDRYTHESEQELLEFGDQVNSIYSISIGNVSKIRSDD